MCGKMVGMLVGLVKIPPLIGMIAAGMFFRFVTIAVNHTINLKKSVIRDGTVNYPFSNHPPSATLPFRNVPGLQIADDIDVGWSSTLRTGAFVILLLRAGLGLKLDVLRKNKVF